MEEARWSERAGEVVCVRTAGRVVRLEMDMDADNIGGQLWDCGVVLCRHLEDQALAAGRSVLELGAGMGLCGIAAAALGAARVVITDRASVVPFLERNLAAAAPFADGVDARVAELDWGAAGARPGVPAGPYDLILGSDIVYHEPSHDALCAEVLRYAGPGTVLLLAFTSRYLSDKGVLFRLEDAGWEVEEVEEFDSLGDDEIELWSATAPGDYVYLGGDDLGCGEGAGGSGADGSGAGGSGDGDGEGDEEAGEEAGEAKDEQ